MTVSLIALVVSASLTWEQHQPDPERPWQPGTCARCGPTGCDLLRWATSIRAARPVPYPAMPVEREFLVDAA